VTNCHGLKMIAADGKMRLTDVADSEQFFRLIQSMPSPEAEPFKMWLARVSRERIDEIEDPELGIERLMETSAGLHAFTGKDKLTYIRTPSCIFA